jgi:16S rRNA (guanine966-N2)-methyltransferase
MRIISGKFKSRRLVSPPPSIARPTSDRARESLFNILKSLKVDLNKGTYVLDAFAGSGALGLEALSRGAGHITFIEKNQQAAQTIKTNINNLMAEDQCTVVVGDALRPPKAPRPMTLIFLDPPYDQHIEMSCLDALYNQGWINEETLIILETSTKREINLPAFMKLIDQRRYGAALISFITLQHRGS